MRRLVLAATVGAALVATAVPSLAADAPKQSVPVYVWQDPDGSVCFVVSKQVPHCVSTSAVTDLLPGEYHAGPVTVYVNTADGTVGVDVNSSALPRVWMGDGEVCVGYSRQVPFCVPVD